jgi:hypothetical protein
MARAIVRYSFSSEGKEARGQIRQVLRKSGFTKIGTASFEASGASQSDLIAALTDLLRIVESAPDGRLDHMWIYLDDSTLSN